MGAAPISDDKQKWVAWLPMRLFALGDKKVMSLSSSTNGALDQDLYLAVVNYIKWDDVI